MFWDLDRFLGKCEIFPYAQPLKKRADININRRFYLVSSISPEKLVATSLLTDI